MRSAFATMRWLLRRSWAPSAEDERLSRAFRGEERAGFMLAALVRTAICLAAALAVALSSNYTGAAYVFSVGSVMLLAALGFAQFEVTRMRPNRPWMKYAWLTADCIVLTLILTRGNPFLPEPLPPSTMLRESYIVLYFVFLVQAAFTFSPRLVAWVGLVIMACWSYALLRVLAQPGVFFDMGLPTEGGLRDYLVNYARFTYVPLSKFLLEIAAVALLSTGLSIAVARSRRLVALSNQSERARANLARHFSPNLVETLSLSDAPFGQVRRQSAAVLFVDIRDFTRFAEGADPEDVVELLRAYHALLQNEVFRWQGTLDKVMGDGLMATFGVPIAGTQDASRALGCARAMLLAIDRWNEERQGLGLDVIRVGAGLHYGPVVAGNIGGAHHLAFEVIGDTVNIASRLQVLSKELNVRLVVSAEVLAAMGSEATPVARDLDTDLKPEGDVPVRGREQPVSVFCLS